MDLHKFLLVALVLLPAQVYAAETGGPEAVLRAAAQHPAVIRALTEQNQKMAVATGPELKALDSRWRGQASAMKRPTIDALLRTPASQELQKLAHEHQQKQLFYVTDQRGVLLAATEVTYRYIMDDSRLWRRAFLAKKDKVLSDLTATDTPQLTLSLGVRDSKTGDVIGVVSVVTDTPAPAPALNAETPPQVQHAVTTETDLPASPPGS